MTPSHCCGRIAALAEVQPGRQDGDDPSLGVAVPEAVSPAAPFMRWWRREHHAQQISKASLSIFRS